MISPGGLLLARSHSFVVSILVFFKVTLENRKYELNLDVLGVFGKLSTSRGAWAWFHGVWTCGAKVLEY